MVGGVGELLGANREGPSIAEPLAMKMNVRAGHLNFIRISMRCAADIDPSQNDRRPRAVLKLTFCEIDSAAAYVQMEQLGSVRRNKRRRDASASIRETDSIVIRSMLFQPKQRVGLSL